MRDFLLPLSCSLGRWVQAVANEFSTTAWPAPSQFTVMSSGRSCGEGLWSVSTGQMSRPSTNLSFHSHFWSVCYRIPVATPLARGGGLVRPTPPMLLSSLWNVWSGPCWRCASPDQRRSAVVSGVTGSATRRFWSSLMRQVGSFGRTYLAKRSHSSRCG